jgi:hypothetical protein
MKVGSLTMPLLALLVFLTGACNDNNTDLQFWPASLPDGVVGKAYSATITISNNETPAGGFDVSNGQLPKGLTLIYREDRGEDYAEISGTPEEVGTFEFTISVACMATNEAGQEGEKVYSINITN